jgi:hypothetical protein
MVIECQQLNYVQGIHTLRVRFFEKTEQSGIRAGRGKTEAMLMLTDSHLDFFSKVLNYYPKNTEEWNTKGIFYYIHKGYERAILCFNKLLKPSMIWLLRLSLMQKNTKLAREDGVFQNLKSDV